MLFITISVTIGESNDRRITFGRSCENSVSRLRCYLFVYYKLSCHAPMVLIIERLEKDWKANSYLLML